MESLYSQSYACPEIRITMSYDFALMCSSNPLRVLVARRRTACHWGLRLVGAPVARRHQAERAPLVGRTCVEEEADERVGADDAQVSFCR